MNFYSLFLARSQNLSSTIIDGEGVEENRKEVCGTETTDKVG